MKGIVFTGDSFTWGQGLWFYSELPNIKYPEQFNYFNSYHITQSQINYKNSVKFARIVANYYKTFEVTRYENGGSDVQSLDFIDSTFKHNSYEDFSYVIFQTTQPFRSNFDYVHNLHTFKINIHPNMKLKNTPDKFFNEWMESNQYSFDDFENLLKKQIISKIKNKFIELEKNNVKCKLFSWTNDYLELIKGDSYLNERFISIECNNIEFDSIQDMLNTNPELSINNDPYFKTPPLDSHTGLYAQTLIANSIINKINKEL